jgi:hypothetical protein
MAWTALCLCGVIHCADGVPATQGEARSSVIYGQDDREEQRDYPVHSPAYVWARSSAIMVPTPALRRVGEHEIALDVVGTLAESMKASGRPLCSEERFQDEPVFVGVCSAFLVAPDVVVTAGHCVSAPGVCSDMAFVFGAGYDRSDRDPSRVGPDDVYFCRDVPEWAANGVQGDYAVVLLDRPVVGREPLPLRRAGKVEDDEELVLIGNPLGLPTKIAAHAEVLDNAPPLSFKATTDSYGGGSGSVVMGAHSGLVEGVLVRGEKDFVQTGDCWVSKVCPAGGGPCRGEDVSRATMFAAHVPDQRSIECQMRPP